MTTRIRKVITAIDANGNAFSEQHTETLVGDKWFQNDPTTLTDGSAWATQYNAALEATNAQLVSAHKTAIDAKEAALDAANATIATKTQEINGLDGEIQALESQVDRLAEEKAALQNDYDQLNAMQLESTSLVIQLQAKVADLEQYRPFNPRIIDASAFYARITKDEFASLSVSDDATLRTIAKTILAYKTNDWPVVFESPEFQGLISYLVGTEFLTVERAAQLTADATRAEAYDAA